MDMRLAIFHFASLAIDLLKNLGNMRFGIEVELIFMISVHHEIFKILSDIAQGLLWNFIFRKRQRKGQVTVLPFVGNTLIYKLGKL
ncbi:hypothetical protein D3C78_1586710 [compost metagenome]